MKDFSWNYFINTGDVDAYLLYKNIGNEQAVTDESQEAIFQLGTQEMSMGEEEA